MEEITFRVVEVDGVLAEVRPLFNGLATAVLDKPVEVGEDDFDEASRGSAPKFTLPPPHTIHRLSVAAGLSPEEEQLIRNAIAEIRDFWLSVPPVPPERLAIPLPHPERHYGTVFHVNRVRTRGDPVIIQTIKWLMIHGYKNPVVWVEES